MSANCRDFFLQGIKVTVILDLIVGPLRQGGIVHLRRDTPLCVGSAKTVPLGKTRDPHLSWGQDRYRSIAFLVKAGFKKKRSIDERGRRSLLGLFI